ncbi:MAG: helix-turn-helix domain-containing protein [Gammaproteobacteria bacterium]|nr:helix-turn-helix domain-containing protein [Gammaproteobacteria bacterium]
MDRFTRIFELHKVLTSHRHPASRAVLEERLECSRATVKRAIDDLRDHLGAPVTYDRARNGYHYDTRGGDHPYQLPGLWFSGPDVEVIAPDHLRRRVTERVQETLGRYETKGPGP